MRLDWRPARRPHLGIWVLLGHALLLWAWLTALHQTTVAVPPQGGAAGLLRLLPVPPDRWRAAAPEQSALAQMPRPETKARARRIAASVVQPSQVVRQPASPTAAPMAQAEVTAAAPDLETSAREPLLQTEATRRALHDFARQPLLSERAASAIEQTSATRSQALARQVGDTLHGDCSKGEFAGGGMGLLSVPFLLAAKVSGRCAR